MTMLVLEIEYLSGVCYTAPGPDEDAPEWPPQPDRIFSALTAAWAARGEDPEERKALEWLERQDPPVLESSGFSARSPRMVFVPPNDFATPQSALHKLKWYREYISVGVPIPNDKENRGCRREWQKALSVLPEARQRFGLKERRFPAAVPLDPVVRLLWSVAGVERGVIDALQRLARDVAYVGHSSSLTRCRFLLAPEASVSSTSLQAPARGIYPGRLQELEENFRRRRRPSPGPPIRPRSPAPPAGQTVSTVFADRWLILEHVAGVMPDLRAAAVVAKAIRDTILSGYERAGLGASIPEVVSGHGPSGEPSQVPHLAVVPLPFVGLPYADGHVMGFALVPPHSAPVLEDPDFRRALRAVAPLDENLGRRVITVQTREGTPRGSAFSIRLSPTMAPTSGRRSLEPTLYTRRGRYFATVTPVVLDRHLKTSGPEREEEIKGQVFCACRNVGLPEPEIVLCDKHSALAGVPSAYPSRRAPAWTGWRLPPSLASRQLTHVVLGFPLEIKGPVLIGAGRYLGLGLLRPLA